MRPGAALKVVRFVCPFVLFAIATALAQNPVPIVNQPLVPDAVAPGGSSFTLTVNGTEFVSASVINWNGAPLATTFVNSSQLTATVPAQNIATAGTASITVSSLGPGAGASNTRFLQVTVPASPRFTSLGSGFGLPYTTQAVAGDFNGEGILDLAFTNYDQSDPVSSSVCIQLGKGDGSFQSPTCYDGKGDLFLGVVAADLNGDGKLDLVVSDGSTNTVNVFQGNGDGTLRPAKAFATGFNPGTVVAADLNGDGKLDLVTANFAFIFNGNPGSLSVLLGNGDGTFKNHVDYNVGAQVTDVAVGDFNRDGNLDVAFVDWGSGTNPLLYVLPGNGDGTFQPEPGVPSVPANAIGTADLNNDGKLDLLMVWADLTLSNNALSVFIGNGDGTFQPRVDYSTGSLSNPERMATADFNGDGKLDVVVTDFNSVPANLGLFLGNGDGTLQPPLDIVTGDRFPFEVVAADFNGDGEVDLAATLPSDINSLQIWLQGTFPVATPYPTTLSFAPLAIGMSSSPELVTLTNTGVVSLSISGISMTGANPGDFSQTNDCGTSLAVSANCLVNVTFTPKAGGIRTAAISITDNAPGNPQSVPLTGTGNGPTVNLAPSTVTFPDQYVGTSGLPQSLQLTNNGNAPLTLTSVTASPADFAPLSTCGSSLAAGASCSIGVFFDPTASGTRNGTLTVTDSASNSPQTASLTGVGEDFSMASSGSATATVSPGGSVKYTLAIAPAGGFKQTVSFTCSGAPAAFLCSVPSSVTLNGSSATMLTVTVASGASARLAQPGGFSPVSSPLAMWLGLGNLPGLLIMSSSGAGRRHHSRRIVCVLAFVCLFSLAFTWTGCGGGSSGGSSGPGTYNLIVIGKFTSGATTLTHDTNLTLVAQ